MAKLDLTSPASRRFYANEQAPSSRTPFDYNDVMSDCPSLTTSSSLSRSSRPFYGNGQAPSSRTPFDYMSDCPLPTTRLSPPPREAALSFDQFAPVGGIDPFVPNMVTSTDASNAPLMGDMFQASLPFDEEIVKSMQSMTDPNIWQNISLPGIYIPCPNT